MQFKILTDGGARGNPGPAAAAFVVKDDAGKIVEKCGKYLGDKVTNNVAEYQAVILALKWLLGQTKIIHYPLSTVKFYSDSELIVKQLNGEYKIKDLKLKNLIIKIRDLERQLDFQINYNLISRLQNTEADHLVNKILDQYCSL